MSDTSGGTAPNGFNAGGRSSASAGSAGMVMTFSTAHRSPSRCHSHTDAERSSTLITTPTKPYALDGSWAGRSSSTIWCCIAKIDALGQRALGHAPEVQVVPELSAEQVLGISPPSIIDGVAHSEVTTVSWRRCHHTS